MQRYDHGAIEAKWQKRWEEEGLGVARDATTPDLTPSFGHPSPHLRRGAGGKSYVLVEFPYPSGDGLHVGHVRSYTALDAVARKRRMEGKNVLFPIGWDAFGLPTENYALKTGVHPRTATDRNIATFRTQLKRLGISFDWSREVDTTDPKYYKWTQWIFLQLLKHGLAYQATIPISWCPKDKIGLANEEVVGGKCERCGTEVERRMQKQWMLKITAYADRLLSDLDTVDYSERIKTQQQNWIGRSEGAEVRFEIESAGNSGVADTMRFVPELVPLVLDGSKYKTYRFFESKKVGTGDLVDFIDSSTKKRFATARITKVEKRNFIDIPLHDKGHEPDVSIEARRERYEEYYKKTVRDNTPVWIYTFMLEKGKFGIETLKRVQGDNTKKSVTVFTTRPDTLFGAAYLVLSPEHSLVEAITSEKQRKAVEKYKKDVAKKSDLERTALEKEKTGVFTGAYAVNPANNEKIPVWIADYVLMSYGTGAIMAVPAHDERDFAFAKKCKLPIVKVIKPPSVMPKNIAETAVSPGGWGHLGGDIESDCWTGDGTMVNLGKFDGMTSEEGRKKIVEWLANEANGSAPTCLVVHGVSGHKKENWFPWIKKELGAKGWNVIVPTMPGAGHPTATSWDNHLRPFDTLLDDRSVLVGHSLGCAAILRHLQSLNKKVDTVIFVAPTNPLQRWNILKRDIPDTDWDAVERMNQEKDFDWGKIRKLSGRFIIIFSDNDPYIPEESMAYYRKYLPDAEFHRVPGKFHFSESGGITELPEILKFIPEVQAFEPKAKPAMHYKLRDWVFSRQHYWGEPIPVVHCEKCKRDAESTRWTLNFYESGWTQLKAGYKTVETRALNPEEKDRYYGDIKAGDIIKCMLKGTDETMYISVTGRKIVKKLNDLLKDTEYLRKMVGQRPMPKTQSDLERVWALTPDYLDRIRKHGLVTWTVEHVIPGVVSVPEKDLPVELPDVEKYQPSGTGKSPLANVENWVNVKCPHCGGPAKRETDTMPNWAGSSWYFLRYCDPRNEKEFASMEKLKHWMPVDLYNGGMEHTTLHLLYSRFWHKFLYDHGHVPTPEPYARRRSHGIVLASDGRKMSKSFGNVVNPDELVKEYGADSVRLYEMFMGPFEDAIPWDEKGIVGVRRFLEKVWDAFDKVQDTTRATKSEILSIIFAIKITKGVEEYKFNTCVSDFMKWSNSWKDQSVITKREYEKFIKILHPFAPHITEELWNKLNPKKLLIAEAWPDLTQKTPMKMDVRIVVQVNGKLRGTLTIPAGTSQNDVEAAAKAEANVAKYLTGKPKKVIFVKDRLINFVV